MAQQKIYTSVRVGIIQTPFLPTLKRFNPGFVSIRSVMGNTEQYAFYEHLQDQYFIQVSKSLLGIEPKYNYNLVVSVISEKDEKPLQVVDDFGRKTGIELRKAPPFLDDMLGRLGCQLFPILKESGSNWVLLANNA